MHHGLRVDHVVDERRIPGHEFLALATVHPGQHLHPHFVLRLPLAVVIGRALVLAHALGRQFQLAFIPLIDTQRRHAQVLPVFQADRVDHHQLVRQFGIHQRVARGQHAAGRVADDDGLLHADRGQELACVVGQLLERVLVMLRLGGFAKADLVGHHDAVAGVAQCLGGAGPGRAAEVLAVHEDDGAAVRAGRLDVHIGHLQIDALRREAVLLRRCGIGEFFEFGAVDWRGGRLRLRRDQREGETEARDGAGDVRKDRHEGGQTGSRKVDGTASLS